MRVEFLFDKADPPVEWFAKEMDVVPRSGELVVHAARKFRITDVEWHVTRVTEIAAVRLTEVQGT